jgi:hypothetical protein
VIETLLERRDLGGAPNEDGAGDRRVETQLHSHHPKRSNARVPSIVVILCLPVYATRSAPSEPRFTYTKQERMRRLFMSTQRDLHLTIDWL